VWKFLQKRGFTKIKLTEINFKNQVGLFNHANIIIGAHGAGLSNMIFSKSETKVIEIKPEYHVNDFFPRLSKINNLNYNKIVSKDLKLNIENKPGDIFVDLNDIAELIN
jgi:capsular polysaccharide biosynthesis protein